MKYKELEEAFGGDKIVYVSNTLFRTFSISMGFDNSVAQELSARCLARVLEDIYYSADKDFNDSDISIALSRLLLKVL